MNIILGLTGSVATTLAPKIVKAIAASTLEVSGAQADVLCVMTEKAKRFCNPHALAHECASVVDDSYEWADNYNTWATHSLPPPHLGLPWKKNDPVRHIEMAREAAALVIAPATINTIAKMAHGVCDNLLMSIYFALPKSRPVIIAPAANSNMWFSEANQENITTLKKRGVYVVAPIEKELACGDFGMGALARIEDIAQVIPLKLQWNWPLGDDVCHGLPVGKHLGAFGAFRKHGKRHCGVDLYSKKGALVYPVEDGVVVAVDGFTGASVGSSWWNETMAVKIEGPSGVVCYGEIDPYFVKVGRNIHTTDVIGSVAQVLKDGQERTDIPGHSLSMLHIQLYAHGVIHKDESWSSELPKPPPGVLDPTPFLINAANEELQKLEMP